MPVAVDSAPAPAPPTRTPWHLWAVGVVSLLWNAFGAFDYLATQFQFEAYMSSFTEDQLQYFYSFPAWATAAWAFGVWGSLVGSVGLLLRRRWALWAFVVSLLGLAASSVYTHLLSNGPDLMGPTASVMSVVIWAALVLFLAYAWAMARRGVLR